MAIGTRTRNSWMKRVATFVGGDTGIWRVTNTKVVAGPPLKRVDRIAVIEGNLAALPDGAKWLIHGVTSNERYTTLKERKMLLSRQPALGRPEATRAALFQSRSRNPGGNLAKVRGGRYSKADLDTSGSA